MSLKKIIKILIQIYNWDPIYIYRFDNNSMKS